MMMLKKMMHFLIERILGPASDEPNRDSFFPFTHRGALLSLFLFSIATTLLMNLSWNTLPPNLELGSIARQDVRADRDYSFVDEEETDVLKRQAMENVLPIFDWDEDLGSEKIIESHDMLTLGKEPKQRSGGIMIRRIRKEGQPQVLLKDLGEIWSLEEARQAFPEKPKKSESSRSGIDTKSGPKTPSLFFNAHSAADLKPNLFFNESETKAAQEKAVADVSDVVIRVQAGESIIRNGDRFDNRQLKIINNIRLEKNRAFGRTRLIGTALFVCVFLCVCLFVLKSSARNLKAPPRDFLFLGVLLLIMIGLQRLFLFISGAVHGLLPIDISLSSFYTLFPIPAGSMMVRLVLPLPMALLFLPISVACSGLILQGNLTYTLYYLVGSVLGLRLMEGVQNRWGILKAGLQIGVINSITILTLDMLNVTSLSGVVDLEELGLRSACGFLGGCLNAVVILTLMPLFETLFNYVTPIKLLEYGSLNHPLLRELIVRAPGTYHHSHMVGTLAEAACEAIGADSIFARVACYFHDIGKMKKSPYFIENQSQGEDRHLNLSPSMSALIVASHVKDGMELARSHKVPERIIDIIPQHQGTKLISYFYNKAKEAEDANLHVVDEREYRYPGPKPQTREAGVILLADTIEAATRALKDRSPARLEEVVRNMINKNFIDGQLDECDLTLTDLHLIGKSFVRILMGVYHQRIEYPPDAQDLAAAKAAKQKNAPDMETDADKYLEQKPLREDSLQKTPNGAHKSPEKTPPPGSAA